jgi:hypothetical protein
MALAAALLLSLSIAAPADARQEAAIDLPESARAGKDGFVVGIATTDDLEGFARAWAAGGPKAAVTQRAGRGRELTAVLFLQDCRPRTDGTCNVAAHFTYLRPDGTEYGTVNDDELWTSAPRAGGGIVVAIGPALIVDPPDPMGRWTLRAQIRDNVRGVTVTVETPIVVDTPATPSR